MQRRVDTTLTIATNLETRGQQERCIKFSPCTKTGWIGSRVVSVLESGAVGPGFKSQSRRCRVTVVGKLFTPHRASVYQTAKLVAALLRVAVVTAGLAESNGSLYRRVYDSRHLQADCQEPGSAPETYAQ